MSNPHSALDERLTSALHQLADAAPHDADLVGLVRSAVRRRRLRTAYPIAALLAVVVVLGGIRVTTQRATVATPSAGAASACRPLDTGPLPEWARVGFTGPDGNPFALSSGGSMVAVVFANPLVSPPAPDRGNKILWVPDQTPAATDILQISATLEGSDLTATVDIGTAPGPSYVDLPAPGCWHLALRWGSHTDSVDLRWEAG